MLGCATSYCRRETRSFGHDGYQAEWQQRKCTDKTARDSKWTIVLGAFVLIRFYRQYREVSTSCPFAATLQISFQAPVRTAMYRGPSTHAVNLLVGEVASLLVVLVAQAGLVGGHVDAWHRP